MVRPVGAGHKQKTPPKRQSPAGLFVFCNLSMFTILSCISGQSPATSGKIMSGNGGSLNLDEYNIHLILFLSFSCVCLGTKEKVILRSTPPFPSSRFRAVTAVSIADHAVHENKVASNLKFLFFTSIQ